MFLVKFKTVFRGLRKLEKNGITYLFFRKHWFLLQILVVNSSKLKILELIYFKPSNFYLNIKRKPRKVQSDMSIHEEDFGTKKMDTIA